MTQRRLAIALGVALALSLSVQLLAGPRLAGLSIDLLYWLREKFAPVHVDPAAGPVAVVAIDEETMRRPPFADLPREFWTPEIARVLNALVQSGVKVVGFDVIFAASGEGLVPGFDRDLLLALRHAALTRQIVLGEAQHQRFPIHPFPAQAFMVGASNLRDVNVLSDPDSVVRRIPLTFQRLQSDSGTTTEAGLPLELASRGLGEAPVPTPDGGLTLTGRPIPGAADNAMLLNFAGPDAVATYSLADLFACEEKGDAGFFREHFAGKIVLLGTVLDIEDRLLTSMRLITRPEHPSQGERCVNPPMDDIFRKDLVRATIPGVFVLATAADNLIAGNALREAGPWTSGALVLILALAAAAATQLLPASRAALVTMALAILWTVPATLAFCQNLVLPLLTPPLAAGLTLAVLQGYRFAVTDRDRRLLRNSFSLYLAPALVDRMLKSERLPELGGEAREVTVMFADIAGFTGLSESLTPGALVQLMNAYLSAMTDIIEAESGFVDKYIGDAIVAVFGAPVGDPDHPRHAVRAALACRRRLAEMNESEPAFAGHRLKARIGLASGEVVVGNVGSRRRFNYTVMGDTVNLASRLEGANKAYGTDILVGESVRIEAGNGFRWREIDLVRVKGREAPERIFSPDSVEAGGPEADRRDAAFVAALAAYRAGDFSRAAAGFEAEAAADPVAAAFVRRLGEMPSTAPADWRGISNLETK
jgi:adenylate cyclase